MWWGGGGDEHSDKGEHPKPDSTSSGPEVMEILSEEDTMGIGGDVIDPDEESDEELKSLSNLKSQFVEQETLLGQLRGALRSNEEKLLNKEKEVQAYAARVSRTGVRSRMSDSATVETAGTGKIRLLKRQLEEARMKEMEEMDKIKDLELLVRDLQRDVAERDKMIHKLKEDQFSVASFQTSPPQSPFVMSPRGGSPTNISPSRSPPLGQSFDSNASFESYAKKSFTEKDEKIVELQEKNIELERKVMELEDSVKAKDEIIRARTEAVTLMSADLSAKGKAVLDELDETKAEMKEMQRNFTDQESKWREERSTLLVDLESKTNRLEHLDGEVHRIEKMHFELATKNAELQEKVVSLQAALAATKREKRDMVDEFSSERTSFKAKLEELEKELVIAKANRKERDAELLEELKEFCLDEEFNEKFLEMQQKVTELEEEKGNLQLKLVEFENGTNGHVSKFDYETLERELHETQIAVEGQKSRLHELDEENKLLNENLSSKNDEISRLSAKISDMLESQEEMARSKVVLEMRCVELEEQRDRADEDKKEFQRLNQHLKDRLEEKLNPIQEIEAKLASVQNEYEALKGIHSDYKEMYKQHEKELTEKCVKLEEAQVQIAELERMVGMKNSEIIEGLSTFEEKGKEIENLLSQVVELKTMCGQLETEKADLNSLVEELKSDSKAEAMEEELESLRKDLYESNVQLTEKGNALIELESKYAAQSEEMRSILEDLKRVEISKNDVESQLNDIASQLEEKTRAFEEEKQVHKETIENLNLENEKKEKDLEDCQREIRDLNEKVEKFEGDLSLKNEEIEGIMNNLASKNSEQSGTFDELQKTVEKLKVLEEENASLKEKLSYQEGQRKEEVQKLSDELNDIREENTTLQTSLNENVNSFETLKGQLQVKEEERMELMMKLQDMEQQLNIQRQEELVLKETVQGSATPGSKNESLQKELDQKISEIQEKTEDIRQLSERLKLVESDLSEAKKQVDELEKELDASNKEKTVLVQQLNNLSSQIGTPVEETERLKSELHARKDELNSKSNELSDIKRRLQEIMNDKQALEATLAETNQKSKVEADSYQDEIESLKQKAEESSEFRVKCNDLSNELEKVRNECKSLKENYESLVSGQGDQKGLIQEKDKLKEKNNLLTEKCKKLVVKCKQQETKIGERDKEVNALKEKLTFLEEKLNSDENGLKAVEQELENERRITIELNRQLANINEAVHDFEAKVSQLEEVLRSRDSNISALTSQLEEKSSEVEKWQTECMEKDTEIESLRKDVDSLKEKLVHVDNLEEANAALKKERSHLYGDQTLLKDEMNELQRERSQLLQSLDDARKEIKTMREANIMSQMMESNLLKQCDSTADLEVSSVKVEVGSTRGDDESILCETPKGTLGDDDDETTFEEGGGDWGDDDGWGDANLDNTQVTEEIPVENYDSGLDNLKGENESLKSERNSLFEAKSLLQEEVDELQAERIKLLSSLEEARKEIKMLRESAVVSKMLDSHILKNVDSTVDFDASSSIRAEAGSNKDEEEEIDNLVADEAGEEQTQERETELDMISRHKVQEIIKGEEGFQGFGESADEQPESGWGGWDEEEVEIPDEAEKPKESLNVAESLAPKQEVDVDDGWRDDGWTGGWGEDGNEDQLSANLKLSTDEQRSRETSKSPSHDVYQERSKTASPKDDETYWQAILMEKDSYIESLENNMASINEKLTSYEENLKLRECEKEELLEKIESLSKEVQAKEEKMRLLSEETEQHSHALESSQLSASTCMERLNISDEMIADYKKRIEDLSDEQKSLQLELMSSYEELEILRPLKGVKYELEEAKEKIDSLETYLEELQGETSRLNDSKSLVETELQSINEQLEFSERERVNLEERLNVVTKKKHSLDGQVEYLESKLEDKVCLLESLKEKNEELEMSNNELDMKNDKLSKKVKELEGEISKLRNEIKELREEVERDDENNLDYGLAGERQRIEAEELKMEIIELERSLQLAEESLQNVESSYEKKVAEMREQFKKQDEEIALLKKQHEEAQEKLGADQTLKDDIVRYAQELEQAQTRSSQLQQRITELENSLRSRDEVIVNLQTELNRLSNEERLEPSRVDYEAQRNNSLDLAASNRPPPDVTHQGQQNQPDVASHFQVSPDIMHHQESRPFEQVDLVQEQQVGAGSWFDQAPEPECRQGSEIVTASGYFASSSGQEDHKFQLPEDSANASGNLTESNQQARVTDFLGEPRPQSLASSVPEEEDHQYQMTADASTSADGNPPEINQQPRLTDFFSEPQPDSQLSHYFDSAMQSSFDSTSALFQDPSNNFKASQPGDFFGGHGANQEASPSTAAAFFTDSVSQQASEDVFNVQQSNQEAKEHNTEDSQQEVKEDQQEGIQPSQTEGIADEHMIKHYQTEIENYRQVIEDWKAWADSQTAEFTNIQQSLQQYVDAYNAAIAELEQFKSESQSDLNNSDNLEKLESKLRTKEFEINDLNETIDRLKCEKDELSTQMMDLTRTNQELRDERDEIGHDKIDIATFDDLKIQLDAVVEERDKISSDLESVKSDLTQMQNRSDELQRKLTETENDKMKVENEKLAVEKKVSELTQSLNQLEKERNETIETLKLELKSANDEKEELSAALEDQKASSLDGEESKTKLSEALAREQELQQKLNEVTQEFEVFKGENDVQAYQTAIGEWQAWSESQNQEFAKLQESLQQYVDAYNSSNEALLATQNEVTELKTQIQELDRVKGDLEMQIDSLKTELNEIKAKNLTEEESKQQSSAENEIKLKNEINQALQEKAQLQSQVQELQAQFEREQENLKAQLQEIQSASANSDAVASLQKALDSFKDENERLNVRITLMSKKYSDMETNQKKLKTEAKEAAAQIVALESEKTQLLSEISSLKESLSNPQGVNEYVKNLETENSALKNDCESLKMRLEALENEKTVVAQSEGSANQDYAYFQELNQNLQAEIQGLRDYINQQQSLNESFQPQESGWSSSDQQHQQQIAFERQLVQRLEQDLQFKDAALRKAEEEIEKLRRSSSSPVTQSLSLQETPTRDRKLSSSSEVSQIFSESRLVSENDRLKQDLDKSIMENRLLSKQMENWKQQLTEKMGPEADEDDEDDDMDPQKLKMKQEQAWRSVGALQLRVEELTLEVTKLLEERDTLQLKLSNVMRQYERQRETSSRASTACSTPIPWVENTTDIRELKAKIEELSKLNYNKDIELQKQKQQMEAMQIKIRHHQAGTPTFPPRSPTPRSGSQSSDPRATPVLHL